MNKDDNPETPADETLTGWDDLQPELDALLNKIRNRLK